MNLPKEIKDCYGEKFSEEFVSVVSFLSHNPALASERVAKLLGSNEGLLLLAEKMSHGRQKLEPSFPKTKPDPLVPFSLQQYFGVNNVEQAMIHHNQAMAAENIIGHMLEAYIYSIGINYSWIWCSGNIVKAVDFLKWDGRAWIMLQVKNRSNSENSSSAAIRNGTDIIKWYRIHATTGASRWDNFPDSELRSCLSEDGFKQFVAHYLKD